MKNDKSLTDAECFTFRMKIFAASVVCFLTIFGCKEDVVPHQPEKTGTNANETVRKYDGYFQYGSNMGWINENWNDESVADVLVGNPARNMEGVGVTSLRPTLPESFLENWSYDIRAAAFEHYGQIGATQNAVFIGDSPSDKHRDGNVYGKGEPSESFKNLYEPIWDNGENGTPVNDNNYYALYVYKTVQMYGKNVRFWEIKNEADFTYGISETDGWWDADPDPDLLENWRAPIQHYVRLLRVSYEVIKRLDPDAYVCIGGIGYASFLDAVLRNTDNPDGGKVTGEYPLGGGAWFDCLSYHIYPMYFLRRWGGTDFIHYRHSDVAVQTVRDYHHEFAELLQKYGYGAQYPAKEVIITETNIPSKQVGEYIGSEESQRNYVMKVATAAQQLGMCGVWLYGSFDNCEHSDDCGEYDYKGLYKAPPATPGMTLRTNESGVAWRTMSRNLSNKKYDPAKTAELRLPSEIDGGAFRASDGSYTYVLWAKTTLDRDETAAAQYTFPAQMNVANTAVMSWDGTEKAVAGNTLPLTGAPVLVRINATVTEPVRVQSVKITPAALTPVYIGAVEQFTATIQPANAAVKTVTWTSDNPAVATIDNSGKFTALKTGKTNIRAVSDDKTVSVSAVCPVEVTPTPVGLSYILIDPSWKSLKPNETVQINITIVPTETTNRQINWSSANANVATVSQTGMVTATGKGETTVTATPADGGSAKAKSCTIRVE